MSTAEFGIAVAVGLLGSARLIIIIVIVMFIIIMITIIIIIIIVTIIIIIIVIIIIIIMHRGGRRPARLARSIFARRDRLDRRPRALRQAGIGRSLYMRICLQFHQL